MKEFVSVGRCCSGFWGNAHVTTSQPSTCGMWVLVNGGWVGGSDGEGLFYKA